MSQVQICTFCQSQDTRIFFNNSKNNAEYFQCTQCGLIWLDSVKRVSNAKDYYSTVYYKEEFQGRENIDSAFSYRFRYINRYMGDTGRLLEVGAASGDFLHLLQKRGFEVFGVELSRRAVGVAKERYGLDIFCGTLDQASFPNNFFDYVLMYHVLEHVSNPRVLLKEVHRVLKPGGKLLIEVPHPQGFDARFSKRLLMNILDYPNHTFLFTPRLLTKMLTESGFKIVVLDKSFSFLIAHFMQRLKSFFKNNAVSYVRREGNTPLISAPKNRGLVLRYASSFFPGMKLTYISKKL